MATIDYMVTSYSIYSALATGGNALARDSISGIAAMYALFQHRQNQHAEMAQYDFGLFGFYYYGADLFVLLEGVRNIFWVPKALVIEVGYVGNIHNLSAQG
jgi:hypothetical protein